MEEVIIVITVEGVYEEGGLNKIYITRDEKVKEENVSGLMCRPASYFVESNAKKGILRF